MRSVNISVFTVCFCSEEYKYDVPEDAQRKAVTAGLIGGILFFIVAIILSVCTVKICNKKRRRKQERGKCWNKHSYYLYLEDDVFSLYRMMSLKALKWILFGAHLI